MARSRNIKPGFFTNDVLAEIEPLGRLLFAGLWTIADRSGRLEDRPKKIKAEVMPYDDCDADKLLQILHDKGFIIRYEINENCYIQIAKWDKHQNPHIKESASLIPAPDMNQTSTMQEPDKNRTSPAESLNLNPESLNIESGIYIKESSGKPQTPPTPYSEIVDAFNQTCYGLPKITILTDARKKVIRSIWARSPDMEFFHCFFTKIAASKFLNGDNDRNWRADFDWIFKPKNLPKIVEGVYDNRSAPIAKKSDREVRKEADTELRRRMAMELDRRHGTQTDRHGGRELPLIHGGDG